MLASVARNAEEARNIWQGKQFSQRLLSQTISAAEKAPSLGVQLINASGRETSAAQVFDRRIADSPAAVITLVGHNAGGFFRFPDGSYTDLRALGQARRPIVMISCNSLVYANGTSAGLPGPVALTVAFTVQTRFTEKLQALGYVPSQTEMQAMLVSSVEEIAKERREGILYTAGAIGGTGTLTGLVIWQKVS
jgi:hypothetical protein